MRIRFGPDGDLFHHLNSITLQAHDLLGIVREEPKLAHSEIEKDLRPEPVIA